MPHVLTFCYANIIKQNFPQFFLYLFKKKSVITILCQLLMYNSMNHLNVHVYPLSLGPTSHPSHPTPQGHHSQLSFLRFITGPHQSSVLHIEVYICQSYSFQPSLSSLLTIHMSFMSRLYSCPGNRFICTIFLDSAQMH